MNVRQFLIDFYNFFNVMTTIRMMCRRPLKPAQIRYAAMDASVQLEILDSVEWGSRQSDGQEKKHSHAVRRQMNSYFTHLGAA